MKKYKFFIEEQIYQKNFIILSAKVKRFNWKKKIDRRKTRRLL